MERVENEIWCEFHGCVHEETDDPYDYGYHVPGCDEEPECGPEMWRVIWIGRYVKKGPGNYG